MISTTNNKVAPARNKIGLMTRLSNNLKVSSSSKSEQLSVHIEVKKPKPKPFWHVDTVKCTFNIKHIKQ